MTNLLSSLVAKTRTSRARSANGVGKVAEAIAGHSLKKTKQMKKRMEEQGEKMTEEQRKISRARRSLLTLKKSKVSLADKYKLLQKNKRSELVDEYRKLITKLKVHPLVVDFAVDTKKRIIITTDPIKIKKPKWRKERVAGVYQIRIDFSKKTFSDSIRILNITQRFDSYDSPSIRGTKPCWGNLEMDLKTEFNDQDVYELIIDLIDYISSPNDEHGWCKSWEKWFKNAKKMPKNYSFAKYDQGQKEKDLGDREEGHSALERLVVDDSARVTIDASTYASVTHYDTDESFSHAPPHERGPRVTQAHADIASAFGEMGFKPVGAAHYARLVLPEGGHLPSMAQLTYEGDAYALYVRTYDRSPEQLFSEGGSTTELSPMPLNSMRQERFFVNEADLKPEIVRGLRSGTSRAYRFHFGVEARDEHLNEQEERRRRDRRRAQESLSATAGAMRRSIRRTIAS